MKEVILIRAVAVPHILSYSTLLLWLKMHHNRTTPHHAQTVSLLVQNIPTIVSDSTENLKGFSASTWANASGL